MSIDPRALRNAFGRFATGVAVVTTVRDNASPVGVTINSFSSVSLDPPLVLFCLDRGAFSFDAFMAARHFAVNVLSEAQRDLSIRFAETKADKWDGVPYTCWDTGCPILDGCLVGFECAVETRHDGGDHVIFIGRVTRLGRPHDGAPLLYFRGRYREIHVPS